MEPVVLALASNQSYFPGLYCAVASGLSHLNPARVADVRVLDGGLSDASRKMLSDLVRTFRRSARLEFATVDESVFHSATLGPGQSHMTYCRILLPQLLDVPRLIYLDCDVLVFRDLAEFFDLELSPGKVLAAVPDSETLTLGDDSRTLADALNLPSDRRYFNSGVMLMNLDELRRERFFQRAEEFLNSWSGKYRFWDQSAINFLLHAQIDELPEYWNRASWRFDAQQNNDLNCVIHYTTSAPWLRPTPGPAQDLFERFAAEAGFTVNQQSRTFRKSMRYTFWRNLLAPLRAVAFAMVALLYKIAGRKDKSTAYAKVACYWFGYVRNALRRRRLYRQRRQEISRMNFDLHASPLVS